MSADQRLQGVRDGRLLAGPETLQINLANACNLRCAFCWNHSPLRAPPPGSWQRQRLSPPHLARIIEALPRLQPARVLLSGRGEPLLHPSVGQLLRALQRHAIPTSIQTNGTVGPSPDELAALGVDHLLVNASAATPQTYAETHPGQAMLYPRLIQRLERLAELRQQGPAPAVTLVAVIQRTNHRELPALLELGHRIHARALHLKGMEPQPGLEQLCLDEDQRGRVQDDLGSARERAEDLGLALRAEHLERMLGASASGEFSDDLSHGPCFMGWYYLRVTCDGRVMFCCKDKPVDHLDRRPLYQIWRSAAYHLLRLAGRDRDTDSGLFDDKCRRCSNFLRNLQVGATLRRGEREEEENVPRRLQL